MSIDTVRSNARKRSAGIIYRILISFLDLLQKFQQAFASYNFMSTQRYKHLFQGREPKPEVINIATDREGERVRKVLHHQK